MEEQINKQSKISLILTTVLFVSALLVLFMSRYFPNTDLRIVIVAYGLIDIGFIVSMILGVKTKNFGMKMLSILSNGVFFVATTVFALALAVAYGISGP